MGEVAFVLWVFTLSSPDTAVVNNQNTFANEAKCRAVGVLTEELLQRRGVTAIAVCKKSAGRSALEGEGRDGD